MKPNHHYYNLFVLVAICLIIFNTKTCHGFAFHSSTTTSSSKSPIQANDKILVFGGTGGVGQLVTRKLRARENNYNVCVVARDAIKAKEVLSAEDIEYIELNLVGDAKATDDELQSAMEGCTGIVISLGTTGKLHLNLVCLYVLAFASRLY